MLSSDQQSKILSDSLVLTEDQAEALKTWENVRSFTSAKLAEKSIPVHMRHAILRYVLLGIQPGGFLTALLEGAPWWEILRRADNINEHSLTVYLKFLVNDAPADCWKSKENVKNWRSSGGYAGICSLERELVERAIITGKVTWP